MKPENVLIGRTVEQKENILHIGTKRFFRV